MIIIFIIIIVISIVVIIIVIAFLRSHLGSMAASCARIARDGFWNWADEIGQVTTG